MNLEWSDQAIDSLRETARYIGQSFGVKARVRFRQEVHYVEGLLREHPHLGAPEPFLANRPLLYRSVVVGHLNKIVYRVLDDRIEIVDFWDTRREPQAQAGEVKE